MVRIESHFDQNLEGWTVTGDATTPVWKTGGAGSEGGYAEASDRGLGVYWYWSAPPKFLGDKRNAAGRTLSFRLWESNGGTEATDVVPDIILTGAGGSAVRMLPNKVQPGAWTDYTVTLAGDSGSAPETPWRFNTLDGPPVTEAQMQSILGNVTALQIRGEYRAGPDTGRLDAVVMELSDPPAAKAMPIVSAFNDGHDDGWTVFGDVQGGSSKPDYKPSGGVDGSGFVQATDDVQGGVWYWSAPSKFLGNVSSAFGETLSFLLYQSSMNNQFSAPDIILEGAGGRFVYRFRYHPNTTWTPYLVQLAPGPNWHVGDLNGPPPGALEFEATLTMLTGLYIRGEFVTGPDTDGLDNVVLGAPRFYYGDMNNDNANWLPDVAWILKRVAGLAETSHEDIARGDLWPRVNGDMGDGRLEMPDVIEVARRMS